MTAPPLLEVAALGIRFGGVVALEDVGFRVAQGEVFGLLGPNGAGKTTLFNLIAGRYRPSAGRIVFDGREVGTTRPDARCRLGIARTFQITQPFGELTVEENVMVGLLGRHRRLRDARLAAGAFVEMVGLGSKMTAPARQLSTGQRKRLELARAMATGPRILLLDEITGGVDHASIDGLIALVQDLQRGGTTILVIEHNMRVMTQLADRVMFLNRGRVLAEGTPAEIARHPEVEALYLGAAHA